VPVRIELGPKDIETEQAVLGTSGTWAGKEGKEFVPRKGLSERLRALLGRDPRQHAASGRTSLATRIPAGRRATGSSRRSIEEKRGFVLAPWDGTGETEQKVKEETKATIRLLPFEREEVRISSAAGRAGPPFSPEPIDLSELGT
jgi:prolyl-tRNA synthetase